MVHINYIFGPINSFAGDNEDCSVKPRCQMIKYLIINWSILLNLRTLFVGVDIDIEITSKAPIQVVVGFNISHSRFYVFLIETEALLFAELFYRSSIPNNIELASIRKRLKDNLQSFFDFPDIALVTIRVHDLTPVDHEDEVLGF